MITLTKARDIAQHITALLSGITTASGFETDIGVRVFRGRKNIDGDLLPCVVLIEGEDKPGDNVGRGEIKITQRYVCCAYVVCDPDNPNDAAHQAISDLKRRLCSAPNGRLPGTTNAIRYVGRDIGPRPDGVADVMALVQFEVDFAETLADA